MKHRPAPSHTILTNITTDEKLVENFMKNMTLISKQTGIELIIDTNRKGIARMQPGNNKVHINPIHILHTLQAIADKKAKEQGIPNTFEFTINHLSEIVLHEINHIINHTELKLSKKTIEIEGEKLNMLDYQKYIYEKHGPAFHRFNNIFEDIDVNNHATKLQAPVFETSKQEIYQHICVPDANFSEIPLQEQFARTCLRESMIKESCIVDPIVRDYVNYITKPGGLLETIKNPKLSYDEQFPAIVTLYEEYYLPLQEEDKKKQEQQNKNDEGQGEKQAKDNDNGSGRDAPSERPNENQESKEESSTRPNDEPSSEGQQSKEGQKENNSHPELDSQSQGGGQQKPHIKPEILPHLFDNPEALEQIEEQPQNPQNIKDRVKKEINDILNTKKSKKEQKKAEDKKKQQEEMKEKIQQALEQQIEEKMIENSKAPQEKTLEQQIAKERNLDPKTQKKQIEQIKQKIKNQEQLRERLKSLTDDKGNKVYDTIVNEIFSKIINTRKRKQIYEKSPRPFSEGRQFDAHSLAQGIMSWKNGNTDPLMMKQEAKREKEQKKAGVFSITMIADGSGSMKFPNQKNTDQKNSIMLMLYALQQLNTQLAEEDLKEPLQIETQVLMFQGNQHVETIKERNTNINMKEAIETSEALNYANGGDTNAYDAISQYYQQISQPRKKQTTDEYQDRKEKVKKGEIKEILFLLSDGSFNTGDDRKAKTLVTKLREMGIIVCGIGITEEGSIIDVFGHKSNDTEKNKGGFGIVCKQTKDLGIILNSLLLEHLSDQSIIGE